MSFWKKKPKQAETQVSNKKENDHIDRESSKETDRRHEFLKIFHRFTYRYRAWDVWKDFIIMFACSISNSVDKSHFNVKNHKKI